MPRSKGKVQTGRGVPCKAPANQYFSLVERYKTVFALNGLECRDYFEF